MFLALKEMKHEKLHYGLIVAMVVLISYLMFFLMGMMLGLQNENDAAIKEWGTETVFLNKNSNDKNQCSCQLDSRIQSMDHRIRRIILPQCHFSDHRYCPPLRLLTAFNIAFLASSTVVMSSGISQPFSRSRAAI